MPRTARWRYMLVSGTGDVTTAPGSVRFIDNETSSKNTVGMVMITVAEG